eukprot:701301-Rhodomonas_salina.3
MRLPADGATVDDTHADDTHRYNRYALVYADRLPSTDVGGSSPLVYTVLLFAARLLGTEARTCIPDVGRVRVGPPSLRRIPARIGASWRILCMRALRRMRRYEERYCLH